MQRRSRAVRGRWILLAVAALASAVGVAYGMLEGPADGSLSAGQGEPPYAWADPPLRDAPWLVQPGGSPSIDAVEPRASLRFPAGVSYADALDALYVAALERGELPAGTELEEALPVEVVIVEPEGEEGLVLSLTAPWGWDLEARAVRLPSVRLPSHLSPAEVRDRIARARAAGEAFPEGGAVDVPTLDRCQVASGEAAERPTCPRPSREDTG